MAEKVKGSPKVNNILLKSQWETKKNPMDSAGWSHRFESRQ